MFQIQPLFLPGVLLNLQHANVVPAYKSSLNVLHETLNVLHETNNILFDILYVFKLQINISFHFLCQGC